MLLCVCGRLLACVVYFVALCILGSLLFGERGFSWVILLRVTVYFVFTVVI